MRRFFFSRQQEQEGLVLLSPEESKHISRVLRLEAGEVVELLDGRGSVFEGEIVAVGTEVQVRITAERPPLAGQTKVRVAQGVLKGQKMDLVIQKCTELGAEVFIPFDAARSQGKLDSSQARKKQERWQRISLESCKQCMRPQPMTVAAPATFVDLISADSGDSSRLKLLFWEEEHATNLYNLPGLADARGVDIILGPEGGISREEIEIARAHGWQTVSLGQRILRAETATIVALTLVQYLTGNLS